MSQRPLQPFVKKLFSSPMGIKLQRKITGLVNVGVEFGPLIFKNKKNLMLFIALFFIVYAIDYDSLIRPQLEQLTSKTAELSTLEIKKQALEKQEQHINKLFNRVRWLPFVLTRVAAESSPQVMAVSECKKIIDFIKLREAVPGGNSTSTIQFKGFRYVTDNKAGFALNDRGIGSPVSMDPTAVTPPVTEPSSSGEAMPGEEPPLSGELSKPLEMTQYVYEMEVQGSYADLAKLVNDLIQYKKIVSVEKLFLEPIQQSGMDFGKPGNLSQGSQNLSSFQPVKMVISLAILLLQPDGQSESNGLQPVNS